MIQDLHYNGSDVSDSASMASTIIVAVKCIAYSTSVKRNAEELESAVPGSVTAMEESPVRKLINGDDRCLYVIGVS